jgi:hypothetical protein
MKVPLGAIVAFVVAVVCAVLLLESSGSGGGSHRKTTSTLGQGSGRNQVTTATSHKASTSTTRTSTQTKKTTTASSTRAVQSAQPKARQSTAELKAEVKTFLSDYYDVGPNTSDQQHRSQLQALAQAGMFEAKNGFFSTISLGLDKHAGNPMAKLNRLRHRDHLSLKGVIQTTSENIQPLNNSGTNAIVQALVLVHFYEPDGSEKIALLRQVNTFSTWRFAHGQWKIEAMHAPPIGADGQ